MIPEDVGTFRFCPACAAEAVPPRLQDEDSDEWSEWICSGCDRPWIACPCKPNGRF